MCLGGVSLIWKIVNKQLKIVNKQLGIENKLRHAKRMSERTIWCHKWL